MRKWLGFIGLFITALALPACQDAYAQIVRPVATARAAATPRTTDGVVDPADEILALTPTAWFKADAITSLNDGDPVSTWVDSSTSGFDLTGSGASRPLYQTASLNDLPAVEFDGSDILDRANVPTLDLLSLEEASIFVVQYQNAADAQNTTFFYGIETAGNNRTLIHATYDNTIYWDFQDGFNGRGAVAQPGGWDDAWHQLSVSMRTNNTSIIRVDGSLLATCASCITTHTINDAYPLSLGAYAGPTTGLTGFIAEIIVFDYALSDAQIDTVEANLNTKWGL